MMITNHGVIIRVPMDGIRVIGRNTQGVRVMHLDDGDALVAVARVVKEDDSGADVAGAVDGVAPAGDAPDDA
jgi:DNA gyrase subunit A